MLEKGYTLIYCPEAAVYHSHNYTLKRAFGRYFDSGVSSHESYLYKHRAAFWETLGGGIGYLANLHGRVADNPYRCPGEFVF